MSSISSVEDEVESLGDDSEVNAPPPTYYVKNCLSSSGGWPDERAPIDHGQCDDCSLLVVLFFFGYINFPQFCVVSGHSFPLS